MHGVARLPARTSWTRLALLMLCAASASIFAADAPAEVVPLPPPEEHRDPPKPIQTPKNDEKPKPAPPGKVPDPAPPAAETVDLSKQPAPAETIPPNLPDVVNIPKPPPGEPGAETVPLPADRPAITPGIDVKTVRVADDVGTVTLACEKPLLQPREAATFTIYGPESFLREAAGRYAVKDEFDRILAQGTVRIADLPFSEGKPRQFRVELPDPVGEAHRLQMSISGAGRDAQLTETFRIARPAAAASWSWLALVATPPANSDWTQLRALGIRGGMQYRLHPARREALRKGHAPFYVENAGHQLLSRYHTEAGLWEKTLAGMADEKNRLRFYRDPSLSSQAFAEAFTKELQRHAEAYAKEKPLFYSLASEPSVTRLAAAVDFDFSPDSLAEFQRWLERDAYGTIPALNAEWGTHFKSWSEVIPMTTDEARLRLKDGVMNFAPWVDFRDFEDYTFNKVLHDGALFLRRSDPEAKAGITGAMGPFAFGGWDWSRLSQGLDVVECYDIGGARSLWRDLAPGKPALAILSFNENEKNDAAAGEAARAIWSLAFEGGPRGVMFWDQTPEPVPPRTPAGKPGETRERTGERLFLDADNKPTALAQTLTPALFALDGDLGKLLAGSRRFDDGIAMLYSPASVRVQWLLEAERLHGNDWRQAWGADTSAERRESTQLRLRESWAKLLDDLGLSWRWISSAQIESKEILRPDSRIRTIVLPQTIALSDREVDVLRRFVANGGRLVADSLCARFDEHGRQRPRPGLDDLFGVDSSAEPFCSEPVNPLEHIDPGGVEAHGLFQKIGLARTLQELVPFSCRLSRPARKPGDDGPEKNGAYAFATYKQSPLLVRSPAGTYLNLDLSDYLRWRLHPDQPRAEVTRVAAAELAFSQHIPEGIVDRRESRLPPGTQIIRLKPAGASSQILVLRRNPQERLHELGSEAEGNWLFEKAEPFALKFNAPVFGCRLFPPVAGGEKMNFENARELAGTLDPLTPSIFVINTAQPAAPKLTVTSAAQAGQSIDCAVSSTELGTHLYSLRIIGPDSVERSFYSVVRNSSDGTLSQKIPLALNDPTGSWTVIVRDLTYGAESRAGFIVK